MLLSKYFFKTIKEIPNDAELKSHKLLIRGGYIKQISAGIFTYLPIAFKSLTKVENIIREEMNAIDGYEINMPVVMPGTLWQETGRYEGVGDELLRFEDRIGRKMVLGMTHEEAVTDLARYVISSYKQLPLMVYQIQTKFRDEPRVRGGLVRVREFVMKDAYSFHTSNEDLDQYYDKVYDAYHKIYQRCGLPAIAVSSDVGMMGGSGADEFMAVAESGEDTLVICSKCEYKANREVAKAKRDYVKESMLDPEEVHTPGKMAIEDVADFLNIKPEQTLKAIIYTTDDETVMCVIRGDLDINEIKLKNYLKTKYLQFASDEELTKLGTVKGFATPVGLKNLRIIVDQSAAESSNLVAGANKVDYHVKNINYGRDYQSDEVVDISSVSDGEKCSQCSAELKVTRGIEIGNIFKLGTKYSAAMNAKYLDNNGKEKDLIMGCYGIGVGRLLASVLEVTAEENKIIWPISIAPFEVELLGLHKDKDQEIKEVCNDIYQQLVAAGFEVLYDDRSASPGYKFKDADLIGSPIKIAIGAKSIQNGGAEVTIKNGEKNIISLDNLIAEVKSARDQLYQELNSK